jgi:hypothetical protein|tara:strand:- start:96 stop:491 length:396 start_codon:yes stop_codon:yes gene_type:complete
MALTIAQLRSLVTLNLADNSDILPIEHREVENELINFLEVMNSFLPLATGVYSIGDVNGTDIVRTIIIPNVGTSNYYVIGSLQSKSVNFDADNDVFWQFKDPTSTSFKITLREVSSNVQNLDFHWEVKLRT